MVASRIKALQGGDSQDYSVTGYESDAYEYYDEAGNYFSHDGKGNYYNQGVDGSSSY